MCGIAGYYATRHHEAALRTAMNRLSHRGPDHQAYILTDALGGQVGLAHTRLSIIDLDPRSHQPFEICDGAIRLIYNGEIYNYLELRTDLQARGHNFRTESDTEVLARAYQEFGTSVFSRLRGIFAVAILDELRGKFVLARDHMGVKPLYYWRGPASEMFFASEIKSLFSFSCVPREISEYDIFQSLNLTFPMEPDTGFQHIKKVPPGCFIEFDADRCSEPRSFFSLDLERVGSLESAHTELGRACREQDIADVPVGVLFSGGTDSTVLALLCKHSNALIFGRYDATQMKKSGKVEEERYAHRIAECLGVSLTTVDPIQEKADEGGFLDQVANTARSLEEPVADFTYVASNALCAEARQAGVKVVLSGMGGDEAFAGYPRYFAARRHRWLHAGRSIALPFILALRRSRRFDKRADRLIAFSKEPSLGMALCRLTGVFDTDQVMALSRNQRHADRFAGQIDELMKPARGLSPLKQAMVFDKGGFLSHNLTVADKSSMQASVELRVPLLDPKVYQAALALPEADLIRGGTPKYALKNLLDRRLPAGLVHRPKTGFNPPLDHHINSIGIDVVRSQLTSGPISSYLDPTVMAHIAERHFQSRANNTYKLWHLLYLNAWLREMGDIT